MKKFFYMAVAAIAALSSCSSDDAILNEGVQNETGVTTFTATIEGDDATRATYNTSTKKAEWEANTDKISVDGHEYTATTSGATTTFSGSGATESTHHAYFPASLYNGGTPALPATITETWADGKFNMPMYATTTGSSLAFKNLCGVLKITVKNDQIAAVKRIKVSSSNKAVSGAFTVNSDNAAVLTSPSTTTNTLTVTYTDAVATNAAGKVFYVAVPAQTYKKLKVELDADGNGFTKSMITKATADITIERNKIYPISFKDNGHVWVDLGLSVKWATCNIGAYSPEEYGDYFAWGETKPYYEEGHAYDNTCSNWKTGKSNGYIWESYKYGSSATGLTKYNNQSGRGTVDNKTTLESADDAATANWGGSWRMPTKAEQDELINTCYWVWTTTYNGQSVNGYIVYKAKDDADKGMKSPSYTPTGSYDSSDAHIFLPAAGYRYNAILSKAGSDGYYWSSLSESNSANAHRLAFSSGSVVSNKFRYYGYTVRAVCP